VIKACNKTFEIVFVITIVFFQFLCIRLFDCQICFKFGSQFEQKCIPTTLAFWESWESVENLSFLCLLLSPCNFCYFNKSTTSDKLSRFVIISGVSPGSESKSPPQYFVDHFARCNTGPETLPVSVCNCFLYFTCKENILKMFAYLFDSVVYVLLVVFYPSFYVVLKNWNRKCFLTSVSKEIELISEIRWLSSWLE